MSIPDLLLRLTIWFLLTADLSPANIAIGLFVSWFIPHRYTVPASWNRWLKELLRVFWEIVLAIPKAYFEAFEIILRPHAKEVITRERVRPFRTPGLIFLDIFLITFTPKTIVLKCREDGWYEVHQVERRKRP
ncbi:multisubunit sodium/proton antiporter, MrpE subunit [Leptolyngbya sp. PCC 7375]|nr:multisubunit sodium/proton antiporter, MrpE subunit [Leptolyngbya sp. PCC 7375]